MNERKLKHMIVKLLSKEDGQSDFVIKKGYITNHIYLKRMPKGVKVEMHIGGTAPHVQNESEDLFDDVDDCVAYIKKTLEALSRLTGATFKLSTRDKGSYIEVHDVGSWDVSEWFQWLDEVAFDVGVVDSIYLSFIENHYPNTYERIFGNIEPKMTRLYKLNMISMASEDSKMGLVMISDFGRRVMDYFKSIDILKEV